MESLLMCQECVAEALLPSGPQLSFHWGSRQTNTLSRALRGCHQQALLCEVLPSL